LLFLNGFGLWAYLVLWLVVQSAETSAEKLSMSGEPVNLKKIEETVRERSKQVADESKEAVRKWKKVQFFIKS
jgi:hypothetical protein